MNCEMITVFTASYNRKKLLHRLYDSLRSQTDKNFEWLIVDDESSDGSKEEIQSWADAEQEFEIVYVFQKHGGKHRALNKGFLKARGDFFFSIDSDDYIKDNAIETVRHWISEISSNEKIAGVAGLKGNPETKMPLNGTVLFDGEYIMTDNFERERYNLEADMAEIYRTDILKKHLFPEFAGEYFMTEAVCWDAIAAEGYKLRWYNEVIYYCSYLEGGLTKSNMNGIQGWVNNYNGFCYFTSQCIKVRKLRRWVSIFWKFNKIASLFNVDFKERAKQLNLDYLSYLLCWIKLPFGAVCRFIEKAYLRIKKWNL